MSAPGPHEAPRSRAAPASAPSVRVLECDPELGLRVPVDRITGAREGLVAPLHMLGRGVWKAPDEYAPGDLGFLVLEGLLGRDVVLAGTTSTELLGPGDVLHPFAAVQEDTLLRYHVLWHVLEPVRLAVLDETFARRLTAWPQVLRTLLERALRRSLRVSLHAGVLQLSPVETRLVMMFWLLAERWGRVTPAGVVVTLRLSHQLLGQLVGCRRASVTTALHRVEASGLVTRRADRTWLLHGSPPDELAQLHWAQRGERSAGRYDLATFGR